LDTDLKELKDETLDKSCSHLYQMLLHLSICHTIIIDKNRGFNAASPDELALVNAAK